MHVVATSPVQAISFPFVNATVEPHAEEEDQGFNGSHRGESVVSFGDDGHDKFAAQHWQQRSVTTRQDQGTRLSPEAKKLEEDHGPGQAGAMGADPVACAPDVAMPLTGRTLRSIPYRSDSADTTVDWGDEYSSTAPIADREYTPTLRTHGAVPAVAGAVRERPRGGGRLDSQLRSRKNFSTSRSTYRKKSCTARKHWKFTFIDYPMTPMRSCSLPLFRRVDEPVTDADRILQATVTVQGVDRTAPCLPLLWVLERDIWDAVHISHGENGRPLTLPPLASTKLEHVIGKQRIAIEIWAKDLSFKGPMNVYCSVKATEKEIVGMVAEGVRDALPRCNRDQELETLALNLLSRPRSIVRAIIDRIPERS
ncbi:hypothetical protein C8T65DRAFT_834231 [Cerioporus squamosus]|nr:hypothetical protein C8T65DRAFT_834231 [Cerioporus squamosus]